MKNIPTAKELILRESNSNWVNDYSEFVERLEYAFREFAKLHVEAALKEASENAELKYRINDISCNDKILNKNSILNAYPLTNIK
jgi:hypothetical protein